MKNLNGQKGHPSPETQYSKEKENISSASHNSMGLAFEKYEKIKADLEYEDARSILKDKFRLNTTGSDDDLAIDIQDAIDREIPLSLGADNIHVTVENDIVTLEGEVAREQEKIIAGDLAGVLAGEDNVNNYLNVIQS